MGAMQNEDRFGILQATMSPTIVAANTTAEQTFTLPAFSFLRTGDYLTIVKPTLQAGLAVIQARVSATGVFAVTFANNTGAGITPTAAEVYRLHWFRPERVLVNA